MTTLWHNEFIGAPSTNKKKKRKWKNPLALCFRWLPHICDCMYHLLVDVDYRKSGSICWLLDQLKLLGTRYGVMYRWFSTPYLNSRVPRWASIYSPGWLRPLGEMELYRVFQRVCVWTTFLGLRPTKRASLVSVLLCASKLYFLLATAWVWWFAWQRRRWSYEGHMQRKTMLKWNGPSWKECVPIFTASTFFGHLRMVCVLSGWRRKHRKQLSHIC